MEFIISSATKEVSDGVIVGVEQEGSKIIVVARGTLEVLEVA